MTSASAAKTAFTVLTILSSVALRISPLPDFYRVHKNRMPGELALLPVAALLASNRVVGMYAYMIDDILPLLATNVVGVVLSLGFIWVYHRHAEERAGIYKMCAATVAVVAAVLLYTILAATGATNQTRSQASTVLGWVTIATSVVQFAAPLATVKKVIRTKSSASLPFIMCLLNVINGGLWVAYAAVVSDMFVPAPNVVSVALVITQVALFVMHRPAKTDKIQSTTTEYSVVIEMNRSQRNTLERIPSGVCTGGSVFVELASPVKSATLPQ